VKSQIAERPVDILIVDDNPGDMRLTAEALKEGKVRNRLHLARDGVEAIAFLRRRGKYNDAPRPDLILLDLNMPRMNGRDVLAEIKEDCELKHIPVVMLTGSRETDDIVKTYDLHANCYVTKPIDLDQFTAVVRSITDFWFTVEEFPQEERQLIHKPVSILLVEDNAGDRRLIREMLAEAGNLTFDVNYADRLEAAMVYLAQDGVEVILLDLGLPDSQGLETLRKVYAQVSEMPIVVLTGLNDEMVGVQAINEGAQDYLIKGHVDTHLLRRTIRYAIERKQAEVRERRLQLQLNLSSRLASLGLMVEGIAHEINNPLSSVIGFAQMLTYEDLPENTREDIKAISDNAQRVADIVKNLTTFARQHKLERTYVNVNDIISDTLKMRARPLEDSNITITTHLAPELPSTMADATLLQQAFLNLIINAETEMKLAHGKGNLLVETASGGDTIQVSFADDGPGISEANLTHLFDPFFSTRGVGQGTGLGLSVCYGIITDHNGRINVRSQRGQGAVFTAELPVVAEEQDVE
jgi:two-component system, cell cycle sensor histidine kinase and response regulator CckA